MEKTTKKHWLSDDQVKECTRCKTKFSATIRKHHCRVCGDIFCDDCSHRKISVESLALKNERACDECADYFSKHLPFLKRPQRYILYETGSTSNVVLSLSDDEKQLTIKYENGKKPSKVHLTSLMRSVIDGQETKVWRSHAKGLCACLVEPYCFSIVFSSETVDLQCENIRAKTDAFDAYNSLLRIRNSRSSTFIDETRERIALDEASKAQRARDERQRLISDKYSGMREDLAKKYGTSSKGATRV